MTVTILLICVAVILLPLVLVALLYNKLVKGRNQMREGWSGIEVQLKRRHDLVPNLEACVKGVANFEKEVLVKVTEARSKAVKANGEKDVEKAEQELVNQMGQFFALSENYPELQTAENFRALMDDLTEVEDHLQYARRYYNGSARDYNNSVESFPSNILAGIFSFKPAPFFEVEEVSERLAPKVKGLS